jgi:hypothetical protein
MKQVRVQLIFTMAMIIVVVLSVVLNGCEQSFEPFQENDRYTFSIYGYLDASADTQWVRIMPVRHSFLLSPDPIEVTVTLEHLDADGETSTMNDSLFYYGQNAYAWNFWTTMDLQPSQVYRLSAEDSDGNVSSATVAIPDDFPDPVIEIDLEYSEEYVYVNGVDNLADVHSIHKLHHHLSDVTTEYSFSHHQDSVAAFARQDEHMVLLNPSEANEFLEIYVEENPYTVLQREVYVAAAGPEWQFFPNLDEEAIALPDGISNVENGVGYVVGIISKRVPWEMLCFSDELDDVGQPIADPCPF